MAPDIPASCTGCGVALQHADVDQLGYITKNRITQHKKRKGKEQGFSSNFPRPIRNVLNEEQTHAYHPDEDDQLLQ